MGFGSVAATAIMLIVSLVGAAVVSYFLLVAIFQLKALESTLAENVVEKSHTNVVIENAIYNSLANEIYVNITNKGSESIILGKGCDIILDYFNGLGSRIIEYHSYGDWTLTKAYVGDTVVTVPSDVSIEMIPGMTVEISVTPNYTLAPNSTFILVFVLPNGLTSEFIGLHRG